MLVHLIDGTYELFRSYFGAPSRQSPKGVEVGATIGVVSSMASMLRRPEVTHVGIAFDTTVESFRNELFAGYKTGEGIEPEIFAQFPLVEAVAEAMGMSVWRMHEFEADDALATAAMIATKDPRVEQVVIASPDKDLCQCVVDKKIVTWDRRREIVYDDSGVKEKFGVSPSSIPDYLALVGDAADGIPGIKKWGAKSASTVLDQYKTIESIPEDVLSWEVKVRGAKGLSETLNADRQNALLYRRLATLRYDVPLLQSVDDWEWKGPNKEALQELGVELGDAKLADRI